MTVSLALFFVIEYAFVFCYNLFIRGEGNVPTEGVFRNEMMLPVIVESKGDYKMDKRKFFTPLLGAAFMLGAGFTAFAANEISMERAREIALEKTGGGSVTECELDYENGRKVYDIEIIDGYTKYKMEIGVTDSRVYDYSQKTYEAYGEKGADEITAEKAKAAALERAGGGTVVKCKLDFENGRKVYEIDIVDGGTRYEMDVSAEDGKILKYQQKTVAEYDASVSGKADITAEKAREIALEKTGGGTVVECELDYEHGRKVYEFKIVNGRRKYEFDVCVTDSEIYDYRQEEIPGSDDDHRSYGDTIISPDRAKEIALERTGGGVVVKCELDYEDRRQVYEIEIVNGRVEYEMEIDAADGRIYGYEEDYDD